MRGKLNKDAYGRSQFGACRKKRFVAAGNHDLTQRSVGQVFCLVDDENVRRFPLASVREQVHGERRSAALCKRMGLYRQRVRRAIGKDPGSACHTRRASSLRAERQKSRADM